MLRIVRYALLVSCAILASGVFSGSASADDYRHYSDDSRDYWNGYWKWYDGYYQPYYRRHYIYGPDSNRDGYVYRGRIYGDSGGRRYGGYRPGAGVTVGPFSFEYWR